MGARLQAWLTQPLPISGFVAFRAVVGLMLTVSALRFIGYGWAEAFFVEKAFFFKYWGFEWLPDTPGRAGVLGTFWAVAGLGLTLALGLFPRLSALLAFALFSWIQLWDLTNYLNHYYLVSWLLLLLAIIPHGRVASLSARWLKMAPRTHLPAWTVWVLRFQVACVYLFAAKAKFTADWLLHAQPLNIWLSSRTDTPVMGPLFDELWVAYAFSWGGFLYDGLIVFALLCARLRPWAYLVLLGFHGVTGYLFPIGMFPVIMTGVALIFFDPDWPRVLLAKLRKQPYEPYPALPSPKQRPGFYGLGLGLLGAFVAFHLLMPLRQHLYGGNVLWHEQGMRFSWKVMVREKNATVTYRVVDRATQRRWEVDPREFLDGRQTKEFSTQPDMILQLAHAIAAREQAKGREVAVYVDALVSLNGRRIRRLIDPDQDLTQVRDGLGAKPWILSGPSDAPPRVGLQR